MQSPRKTLVVATNNAKKLRELREILDGLPALADVGLLTASEAALGEVEESGTTFEANALIKAVHAYERTGLVSLADDSGLEVDALGGAPGVYSARFAGPAATDGDNNRLLLQKLEGVPAEARTARYRCVIALVVPAGVADLGARGQTIETTRGPAHAVVTTGKCEGLIVTAASGQGGFGYDPYVVYPPAGKTFAELTSDEKHAISHRGQALAAMAPHLTDVFASLGA
ncbi:MAG: RdgB/HAM1 family non-canonical purine NTP pyrophosphatase [Deltaproteobacteria bacterium]|nr:RdgB/HAM1 family non-canonical purine NTP pyrophosphatase [Deltaproteobacteria bacterium]